MTSDRILRGDPFKAPKLSKVKLATATDRYRDALNRVTLASLQFDPLDFLPVQRIGLEEIDL